MPPEPNNDTLGNPMANGWCTAPEDEYLEYLEHERHMYAWCLTTYAGVAPSEAEREARDLYPYEPRTARYRGLIFHDLAWHHAMICLWGNGYWVARRELETPSESYAAESKRFSAAPSRAPTSV